MAIVEQDIVFTTKDADGNTVIQMPITRAENIENVMSIEQGGTGATTVAAARNALGLGNTNGAVPIANGGTGATTAASARTNLGLSSAVTAASISGKTITLTKADGTTTTLTTQDTNTTYSAMSDSEATTGTATTARTITAKVLNDKITSKLSNCAKVPDYSTKTQWTFKGTTYTAPADGFVIGVLNADGSGTDSTIYVNGNNVTWGNDKNPICSLPVCKGDTVYAAYNHTDMYYYSAR